MRTVPTVPTVPSALTEPTSTRGRGLPVRGGPPSTLTEALVVAAGALAALVAGLAATVGVTAVGWSCTVAYAVVLLALVHRGLTRGGRSALGPANTVTLARAVLVGGVVALVAGSLLPGGLDAWALVPIAVVALVLDGVDGRVARRTGSVTLFGARFDMEVDAFLILVLSVALARSAGGWVLAIGLMRYAFVAAALLLPWLRAPLPPRFARKVVAAAQGVTLVVAVAGVLPHALTVALLALALAGLAWSFGRDVVHLHRSRPR